MFRFDVGQAPDGAAAKDPERTQAPAGRDSVTTRVLVIAVLGFLGGLASGIGCATSDQVLEKKHRHDQLGDGGPVCAAKVTEACYGGPKGTVGRGACKTGERTCDEDGQWSACVGHVVPSAETCNKADDDCDGIHDNGFERDGALCSFKGAKGACQTQGVWHCAEDGKSSTCDAPVVRPSTETCNSIDDDCDGETDEDSVAADQRSCTTGKSGVCSAGANKCVTGKVRCVQEVQPGAEICNKLDDDCDGRVDNDCVSESAARKQAG